MEWCLCDDNKITRLDNNHWSGAGNQMVSGFIVCMDILNKLPRRRFEEVDELLAFVSIYDDHRRMRALKSLLRANARLIRGALCVEGGCGLGALSIEMAKLGARKVYAVEQNPVLAKLARQRVSELPRDVARRIEVIELPLEHFHPIEHVNVLVHEFYGQLLYDEDLWVLEHLKFSPDGVIPNGGELRAGIGSSHAYQDRVVTEGVLQQLDGVLVSGLYEERVSERTQPVLRWSFGAGVTPVKHTFADLNGDLVCFGVVVTHDGKKICEAGRCPNWSYVWTLRKGNRVSFRFRRAERGAECLFQWIA
jgi:SAM-dependent methyltransferase